MATTMQRVIIIMEISKEGGEVGKIGDSFIKWNSDGIFGCNNVNIYNAFFEIATVISF